jgi:hypothetical protein
VKLGRPATEKVQTLGLIVLGMTLMHKRTGKRSMREFADIEAPLKMIGWLHLLRDAIKMTA